MTVTVTRVRILVVEDETDLADAIAMGLRREGYAVDVANDYRGATDRLAVTPYDLVTLDLNLPDGDGLELASRIRSDPTMAPDDDQPAARILMLTARDGVGERVVGLDQGADDYLVKPFDFGELSARLRALIRRQAGRGTNIVVHGELAFDTVNRSLTVAGEPVSLSARELALFEALMLRPGAVLSKAQLEDRIYGWSDKIESNAIEVHMHSLRRKIGAHRIRTIRGVGYVLAD